MKSTLVLASVVAALSGLAGFASTANAGTDLSIRIGIGSHHRRHAPAPVVIVPDYRPAGPAYRHAGPRPGYHAPRGYWKDVVVRTWVPARWVVSCDRRGREIRTLHRGYYTEHIDRVWVGHGRG